MRRVWWWWLQMACKPSSGLKRPSPSSRLPACPPTCSSVGLGRLQLDAPTGSDSGQCERPTRCRATVTRSCGCRGKRIINLNLAGSGSDKMKAQVPYGAKRPKARRQPDLTETHDTMVGKTKGDVARKMAPYRSCSVCRWERGASASLELRYRLWRGPEARRPSWSRTGGQVETLSHTEPLGL